MNTFGGVFGNIFQRISVGPAEGPLLKSSLGLTTSAILDVGLSTPDFTRATAASLLDFESLMKDAISSEIRFSGARRVYNFLSNTTFDAAPWETGTDTTITPYTSDSTDPDGGYNAAKVVYGGGGAAGASRLIANESGITLDDGKFYSFSIYIRSLSGTIPLRITDNQGAAKNITATTSWQRFSLAGSEAAGNAAVIGYIRHQGGYNDAFTCYVYEPQAEEVTGQTDKNPADYVSNDILPAPYHGAGVDCVKDFNDKNGNTVDGSGVVTEAPGDPISESLLLGYLCEIGRTNLALYSLDFSNAAWVTSNLSVTTDQLVGKKGLTDADTLTADAANATILQTISSASANRVFTLWLKRKTGTGNIDLTIDNGVTWQNITDDISSLVRVEIKQSAVTNPVFGVRIVTSGDEVYAWLAQLENGDFATSAIETAATAVSRNPDQLSYPNDSYKFLPNEFTFAVTVRPLTSGANYTNNEVRFFGTDDSGGVNDEVRTIGGGAYSYTHATGGGYFTLNNSDLVGSQNARFLFSLSQEGSDVRAIIYKDGIEKLNTTTAGTLDHSDTSVGIGHYAGDYFSGNFKDIKIWDGPLSTEAYAFHSSL